MERGNPGWPYLLSFIRGDWGGISACLSGCGNRLRQFMLEVTLPEEAWRGLRISRVVRSPNVRIDGRYENRESRTLVWTGHFQGPGQEMNLVGRETVRGTIDLTLHLRGGAPLPLRCTVYPGCNSFVKVETAVSGGVPGE
jgi:hypothetical protein